MAVKYEDAYLERQYVEEMQNPHRIQLLAQLQEQLVLLLIQDLDKKHFKWEKKPTSSFTQENQLHQPSSSLSPYLSHTQL